MADDETGSSAELLKKDFKRIGKVVAIVLGLVMALCLLEFFPRYEVIPIHTPDYEATGRIMDWNFVTYSVVQPDIFPNLEGRVFIVRRDAIIGGQEYSLDSIENYFLEEMRSLGWEISGEYAPCSSYLPEARGFESGMGEVLIFRQAGDEQRRIRSVNGDFACLAVWNEDQSKSYNLALVTARPSLLNLLFEALNSD